MIMKKTYLVLCLVFMTVLFFGCNEKKKVKIIEERDTIVKTLHEKDSIRIYTSDSVEVDSISVENKE